ncbi:acyltransferase domain-containing protein [Geomonas sp. Red32]|uniref:ACP S-malonyltransferase n=1 Tax=Geomonas sp. Red32 TaxID=2912856 RepID=UPI00202CCCCE|nr:acyltransferase domain-containing protein [Geomonas sp. Red32]MCM0083085.1 acyltransferase domain-containing protein [Geomonas sp. Red32]
MICFMFPGQPLSRPVPAAGDPDAAELAAMVARVAGLDIAGFRWLSGEGSENVKLQVSGVADSLHRLRRLRRYEGPPGLVAQHSMGIYAALVACGALREEEAIEVTWRVGMAMTPLQREGEYALGCVTGLTEDPLLALARNHRIYLANHNTSRHFLLCGKKGDIAAAVEEAGAIGAFSSRMFDCDAPLHTPLMAPVAGELNEIFAGYRYRDPWSRLMNHLDQRFLTREEIAPFMLRELMAPVYWERTYRALRREGVTTFYEVGSGESLRKYNRWIEVQGGE